MAEQIRDTHAMITKAAPMSPFVGPPLPRVLGVRWPWKSWPAMIRLNGEAIPEKSVATEILKALVNHTINDITYEQMSRIVRRLAGMSANERKAPKRVADILAEELGPKKALEYVEKAFKEGTIKAADYSIMRASLILPMPKEELSRSAGSLAREVIESQRRVRREFEKLEKPSRGEVLKPMGEVEKELKKIRAAWGI